jgi:dipeptidyl-peptidase-4
MLAPLLALAMSAAAPPAADAFLREYAETRRYMAGRPAGARLTADGSAALFLRSGPRSAVQALYETDVTAGRTRELLDAERLLAGAAQSLTREERAELERQRVAARGFTRFDVSKDGRSVVVALSGKLYLVERATGAARALHTGPAPLDPRLSPDGARLAYVRDHDLYVLDLAANAERALTHSGSADVANGLAEFVAQEEMDRFTGYWWSPDGRSLAYEESDTRAVEKLAIADPMHPEHGADLFAYPRAGRANAAVRLGVVAAAGGPTTWVSWDAARYPYLCAVKWEEGGPLALVVMNRAQTEEAVLAADPATGATRVLLEERDPAWLNLSQSFPRWLEDGSGFFWRTERNGAPEVELRDASGGLRASWVRPEHGFGRLVGYDPGRRWLWFTGGPDPTCDELFVVKGGAPPERVPLGSEPGAVVAAALSKGGDRLLVTRATAHAMPRTAVHALDGALAAELPSAAVEPSLTPTTEYRKVGAGEGIWAWIVRPHGAAPGKKLPVIVDVYGGPHAQQVTRAPKLVAQWMADQGYVVVAFDGRGTPRRGRAWERALLGDLGGVNLEDQVSALAALGREVPELDLARVGITGWSFGGYLSSLAVMKRPDVFRAAVAGAPVVDWRDYDTFYTERYLKLPRDEAAAYDRSSLLTYAAKLDRPLLLMHGTADDNVYFFHSLKLSDALFRAGRPHELLPLSGLTHMVPDALVTERQWQRVMRHFREHL